jgi:hypothetical protein
MDRIPVPEHLLAHSYRYRRFRRWIDMLTDRRLGFGYTEPQLAEKLRSTEDVIRGAEESRDVLELSRLWRAAGRLIELPPVLSTAVLLAKDSATPAETSDEYRGHPLVARPAGAGRVHRQPHDARGDR